MTSRDRDKHDDLVDDLEATSADVADDAEQLTEIEHQKEALAPKEPGAVDALATKAEELARRILLKTQMEKHLADELSDRGGRQ
ncbi:MAG: hypothetical protein ABI744_04035 [Chloroflexota bacterium]